MNEGLSRRKFLHGTIAGAGALSLGGPAFAAATRGTDLPLSVPGASPDLDAFLREAAEPWRGSTINVLAGSTAQSAAIEQIVDEFTELTGIDVEFTTIAENELITRTQVTLSAESAGFDIFQVLNFFVPAYGQSEWLVPVDELSEDAAITYPGLSLDNYPLAAIDPLSYTGRVWCLPMFLATQVFYYRTDVFEQHGITPPATLAELVDICAAIHDDPVPAIAMRAGIGPTQNLFPWTSWLYNSGGSYFESYDADSGAYSGSALAEPEAVEAAQLYADVLRNYAPSGSLNWTFSEVTRAFLSGQVAMIQEGSPFGGTLNDPEESVVAGDVGAFAIPSGPAGEYFPSGAQGWGINRFGENVEASWLFSQWATDPRTLTRASLETQFPAPPILSVFDDPAFREKYDFPGFLDSLQTSLSGETSPIGGPYIPALLNWQEVGQQVSVALNEVINGQKDAETAMIEAAEILDSTAE